MGEIKKLTGKQPAKPFEIHGAKPNPADLKIVGGTHVPEPGEVRVLDKTTQPTPVNMEVHMHRDKTSYKKALEKDQ